MRIVFLQLVLVAVLNATGQLSLKRGSGALASLDGLIMDPLLILQHPYFLLGTALYGTSFALYVNALSQTRLSVAYPFIGLTYVFVVLLSAVLLQEPVRGTTIVGVLMVFIGVVLIGFGAST